MAGDITGHLIFSGQIKPVARIMRVQRDSGSQILDGSLRIAAGKFEVAAKPMTVIGIPRRKSDGSLKTCRIRVGCENTGHEFFAGQQKIDATEKATPAANCQRSPV